MDDVAYKVTLISVMLTLITLLRVPILRPNWHKYGTLNRVIRVITTQNELKR